MNKFNFQELKSGNFKFHTNYIIFRSIFLVITIIQDRDLSVMSIYINYYSYSNEMLQASSYMMKEIYFNS